MIPGRSDGRCHPAGLATLVYLLAGVAMPAAAQFPDSRIDGPVPSYRDAPVFYEFAWEYYADKRNLDLAHQGELDVGVIGVVPIADFDWFGTESTSYWIAMENFRYLLPLVNSDRPRDETFVRDWIDLYIREHSTPGVFPNTGAVDAMAAGHRAMTLVWYLRKRHERGQRDDALTQRIRDHLETEREFLQREYRTTSNHGFWEAMGLFETTRVHPDSALSTLALNRLLEMTRLSVSKQGLHMEHSFAYHVWIRNWLKQYTEYLGSLADSRWSGLAELRDTAQRMQIAEYYVYDHAGHMAQIGDTDATRISAHEAQRRDEIAHEPVLFDPQAGLAVLKDSTRYVVFGIQNRAQPINMAFHYHDDALAVYYADDGEIILGDAGRYSYGSDSLRMFYKSNAAHNTVSAARTLGEFSTLRLADSVSWQPGGGGDTFVASMYRGIVTRAVEVPRGRAGIEISDRFAQRGDFVVLWNLGTDVIGAVPKPSRRTGTSAIYEWELTTRQQRKFDLTVDIQSDATDTRHKVAIVEGHTSPYLGWYSPGQFVSQPARAIVITLGVRDRAAVKTSVAPKGAR